VNPPTPGRPVIVLKVNSESFFSSSFCAVSAIIGASVANIAAARLGLTPWP